MFAAEAQGKLKPGTARKWAHETKDMKKLPEHVKQAAFANAIFDALQKLAAKTVVSGGKIKRVVNTNLLKDRLRWKEMATPKPAKVSEVQSVDKPVGQLSKPLAKMAYKAGVGPKFKILKANKVQLTPEERALIMRKKAVWHFGNHGGPTPAVWKAVVNGKQWFVTNTHRAYNVCPTVEGAIGRYHKFIKSTA